MGHKDPRTHLLEKLEKSNVCMLTTSEADGTLTTRPMGLQKAEETGTLWFMTRAASDVASDASQRPVNVSVQDKDFWASVAGHGQVVRDDARKKEFWNPATEAFFGEGAKPEARRSCSSAWTWSPRSTGSPRVRWAPSSS